MADETRSLEIRFDVDTSQLSRAEEQINRIEDRGQRGVRVQPQAAVPGSSGAVPPVPTPHQIQQQAIAQRTQQDFLAAQQAAPTMAAAYQQAAAAAVLQSGLNGAATNIPGQFIPIGNLPGMMVGAGMPMPVQAAASEQAAARAGGMHPAAAAAAAALVARQPAKRGGFLGAPSGMSLYFQTMFGGMEVGRAMIAQGRAGNAAAFGMGLEDQLQAELQAVDAIGGGMLGVFAGLATDPTGARRAQIDATLRSARTGDAVRNLARDRHGMLRSMRRGAEMAGLRGYSREIAEARYQYEDEQTGIREHVEELATRHEELNRAEIEEAKRRHDRRILGGIDPAENESRYQREIAAIRGPRAAQRDAIRREMEEKSGARRDAAVARVNRLIDLDARSEEAESAVLGARLAGRPTDAARAALLARQDEEFGEKFEELRDADPARRITLLSGLLTRQARERQALQRDEQISIRQQERLNDATDLASRGFNLAAAREQINAQFGVEFGAGGAIERFGEVGPNDPRFAGVLSAYFLAQRGAANDDRRRAELSRGTIGAQEALLRGQPLEARRQQIQSQFTAATVGIDPQSQVYRDLERQKDNEIALAEREWNIAGAGIRQTLLTRGEILAARRADDPIRAEARGIVGRYRQEERALRAGGRGAEADTLLGMGREEIDIERTEYLRGLRGEQGFFGTLIRPGTRDTADVTRDLATYDQAKRDLSESHQPEKVGFTPQAVAELSQAIKDALGSLIRF